MRIGEKIAIIRSCRGFSQEYMASKLGIKQNTYSSYELHDDKMPETILVKVAEILGVSVEDIKSPMPIFMSFSNSPNSSINSSNNIINSQDTIQELLLILKKRDEQIDELLQMLKSKDEYIASIGANK